MRCKASNPCSSASARSGKLASSPITERTRSTRSGANRRRCRTSLARLSLVNEIYQSKTISDLPLCTQHSGLCPLSVSAAFGKRVAGFVRVAVCRVPSTRTSSLSPEDYGRGCSRTVRALVARVHVPANCYLESAKKLRRLMDLCHRVPPLAVDLYVHFGSRMSESSSGSTAPSLKRDAAYHTWIRCR